MSTPAREPVMQAAGASQTTPSPWRVKEENYSNSMGPHSHNFNVKFGLDVRTIHCDQPCTVLEAIKSTKKYKEHITCADGNIIIQLGKVDNECIVATHFPCSCVEEDESLIISSEKEVVGEQLTKPFDKMIYPKDRYVLFKIDTVGGKDTKTKKIFRNESVKQFKYLCVYAQKGMTVEEALKRDGRFIDDLGNFELTDNENRVITEGTQKVDNLHKKSFKVCLPRCKGKKHETAVTRRLPRKNQPTPVSDVVQQSGISVKTALEKTGSSVNTEEIYERLRQQFTELRNLMENRFPGDSYQEALNLRRENFGKIQQSFSEVHRIRKMLKLGQSVCKLNVRDVCEGTGFVLFDSFVLTNAHLFKDYVEGGKLQEGVEVLALFGYEDPEPERNYSCFSAKKTFVDFDVELDYAILELNPEGQLSNKQTTNVKVPQGLLRTFCPLPQIGEACIIGHPAGGVKKMDPICIIEKEGRRQNVQDHLNPYKDTLLTLMSIRQIISNRGIDDLMMGGSKDGVVTYNTFMYHGASGSPVFDALGRVFGLHTAGYCYGFPKEESVIEYAQPVLTIFKKFVDNLRESGKMSLLERVKKVAEQNSHLKKLTQDPDSSTPMEVD
ncbi:serine protease FAM111A-like [Clupea harengus]|uniref:Serine protease FAM111A-like n=1 Tax=Clupea harengus TaxID=7950 RepID=A0A8M1KRP6_CLUHA|nr:serine protease FAM111A-like [Clupea harengus]